MALFSKSVNILKQTVSKHVNSDICGSNSSMFQIVRWMSSSKVFVGGISYSTDDTSLREAFNKYGDVVEARVITDRETGRSRGFAFVTYTSSEEASAAIQALDGQDLHGRRIRVNYANERPPRTGGFGGGYGAGAYGGGGGYGGGGAGGGYGGGSNYGNYGGEGGYGNYGSGGGGGSYGGGQSFGVAGGGGGGDGFAQGGSFGTGTGTGFDSGSQSYGVGGGIGGNDNYTAGESGANSGFAGSGFGGSSNIDNASGGFGQDSVEDAEDTPMEGNYRDDDDDQPDDYMNKRA